MTKPLSRRTGSVKLSLRGVIHPADITYVSITKSTERNVRMQTYLSITGLFCVPFGKGWRKRKKQTKKDGRRTFELSSSSNSTLW